MVEGLPEGIWIEVLEETPVFLPLTTNPNIARHTFHLHLDISEEVLRRLASRRDADRFADAVGVQIAHTITGVWERHHRPVIK